jgi:hypothetical protein
MNSLIQNFRTLEFVIVQKDVPQYDKIIITVIWLTISVQYKP